MAKKLETRSGISFFNYESENLLFSSFFILFFFIFISGFYLALEFNISERDKWLSSFSHFPLPRKDKGEKKKVESLFLTSETTPPSFSLAINFNEGKKLSVYKLNIN